MLGHVNCKTIALSAVSTIAIKLNSIVGKYSMIPTDKSYGHENYTSEIKHMLRLIKQMSDIPS